MVFLACLIPVFLYLLVEHFRLKKVLAKIPLRIHVYGTRGKTTATYSIFETLRQAGYKVFGKTTGDHPQLLLPSGEVQELKRRGVARVQEYVKCLNEAGQQGCDAVVFECMAITPETIFAANKMLNPSHVVITNTRQDHHETMGETPLLIAQTLSLSINDDNQVFLTQDKYSWCIEEQAKRKNCVVHHVAQRTAAPLLQAYDLAQNVAKALDVEALAPPESPWPGFKTYHHERVGEFKFLDLFSANDIESSAQLLQQALMMEKESVPLVALLATRPDRPLRTAAFIEWLAGSDGFSLYVAQGWHCFYAQMAMQRHGLHPCLFTLNPVLPPETLLLKIKKATQGQEFALIGLGNFHGYGERFRAFISEEGKLCF